MFGPLACHYLHAHLFQIVERHLPQVHCYADDTQLYVSCPNRSADADFAIKSMSDCMIDIRSWVISDNLMLNDDRTEFLIISTRQQLAKVNINCMRVGSTDVCPVTVARNLGLWFDEQLTMSTHFNKLCGVTFYHLHNIKSLRQYLSRESTEMLAHSFFTSLVDYCKSLLYGLPNYQLNKLHRVLNASARLVCNAPRFCHISPLLRGPHWLPVKARIQFKILLITFKAIHGLAPKYLCDLLTFKSSLYNLRSSGSILLSMPAVRSKTLGDRAFMVAAPTFWNSLPKELRAITNVNNFKAHIKTYPFRTLYW